MLFFYPAKFRYYIRFCLIFIMATTGCMTAQEKRVSTPVETVTSSITTKGRVTQISNNAPLPPVTVTVPLTPTLTLLTATLQATIPVFLTPIPSVTNTPMFSTPTPSNTPVPTLSVEQEGDLLHSLMANNDDCELPCWWGIIPGETSEQEAQEMFISYGLDEWTPSENYRIVGIGYPHPGSSTYSRDVIVEFWVEKGLIRYIGVDGGYRHDALRSTFVQDWHSYRLAEILNRYRMPSYVEFTAVENSPYYRLSLSYELSGFEIAYIMPFEPLSEGKEKICFDLEKIDYIALNLYAPGQTNDIPVNTIPKRLDNYTSWETTTGLDLDTFYETYKDPSNSACVEVMRASIP